jgi:ankyrin repeat protein
MEQQIKNKILEIDPIVAFKEEDVKRSLVAKILLTHGADPNARETQGSQTPLHLCAMNGYSKTAKVNTIWLEDSLALK